MDEFAAEQVRNLPGNALSWYEKVTPHLTAEQRESLDSALRSDTISARAIATVLERWGHPVKAGTISKWRVYRGVRGAA